MTEIEKVVARAVGSDYDGYTDPVDTPANWGRAILAAKSALAALHEAGFVVVSDHEDPTPAMLARGVAIHRTPRSGNDETLVHDIWQAMWDEMMAEAQG